MNLETDQTSTPKTSTSSFNTRLISLAEDFDQLTFKRHSELSGKVVREFKVMLQNTTLVKWDMLAKTLFSSSSKLISSSFGKEISETKKIKEETKAKTDAKPDNEKTKKSRKLNRQSLRLLCKCLLAVGLINENPELDPQPSPVPSLETIPEPSETPTPAAVKPKSASITPIPRVKPSAPSSANLPLRGRHGVNETTSQGPNALSNVKSGAISTFNSVKTSAIKSYENFDLWVASVNSDRKAKGEAPIASSPALAILLLLCGALILLGLARPKQL